jgi:ATP-binding cassette, subfamily B, bacterial
MLAGVLPAAAAVLTRDLINVLTSKHATDREVAALVVAIGAAGAGTQVLSLVSSYVSNVARQRLAVLGGRRLVERVGRFTGLRYFEDPAFHDRLVLAEQAAQMTPSLVTTSLQQILQAVVVIASFLGTLLIIWPTMAVLLGLAALPALATQLLRARQMADTTTAFTSTHRKATLYRSWFFDPKTAKEMRLFGFASLFAERYSSALTDSGNAVLDVERRSAAIQSALSLVGAGITTIGLVVVGRRVAAGGLPVGDMVLFASAVAAIQGSLGGIILRTGEIASALRLFPNYLEIVEAPDDVTGGSRRPDPLRGEIVLHDVWFRYGDRAPWVLKGIDLTIPAGQTLGVVGLNGAGKTTLVKLLLRFYDPDRGSITWDNIDIREFEPRALRERIAGIFQDFQNYDLSAAENIGLGLPAELNSRPRIEQAAERAGVAETIGTLPRGYDTLLSLSFADAPGGRGVTLSGGQWQRIALARSMMRTDADLVVLDEPTAGLDPEAEHEIRSLMQGLAGQRTTLMVSHRLAALRDADRIVVLSEGQIVESGAHEQLIALDGIYARLFTRQANSYTTSQAKLMSGIARPGDR